MICDARLLDTPASQNKDDQSDQLMHLFSLLITSGTQKDFKLDRLFCGVIASSSERMLGNERKEDSFAQKQVQEVIKGIVGPFHLQWDQCRQQEHTGSAFVVQVGASNELPESEELDALYDRFLLRRKVGQVSDAGLAQLLGSSAVQQAAISAFSTSSSAPGSIAFQQQDFANIRSATSGHAFPDWLVMDNTHLKDNPHF